MCVTVMSSYDSYHSESYDASAPPLPQQQPPYTTPPSAASYPSNHHHASATTIVPPHHYHANSAYGQVSPSGYSPFPPGTHPDVIKGFQMVDKDGSGFIDHYELQQALSSPFHFFNIATIRLLMFLLKNPNDPDHRIVAASVLELLISKYGGGSGGRIELGLDKFVEV